MRKGVFTSYLTWLRRLGKGGSTEDKNKRATDAEASERGSGGGRRTAVPSGRQTLKLYSVFSLTSPALDPYRRELQHAYAKVLQNPEYNKGLRSLQFRPRLQKGSLRQTPQAEAEGEGPSPPTSRPRPNPRPGRDKAFRKQTRGKTPKSDI